LKGDARVVSASRTGAVKLRCQTKTPIFFSRFKL
jgi:hypothetical protein